VMADAEGETHLAGEVLRVWQAAGR
jgi:hypothetical protein